MELQETDDAITTALAASSLLQKIDANPSLRTACLYLLTQCSKTDQEETALLEQADAYLRESRNLPIQALSSVVAMLVAAKALEERIKVDGNPYQGSLQEAFEDESISEESNVLIFAHLTPVGALAAQELSPKRRSAALFEEKSHYIPAFQVVLNACAQAEEGVSTKELEVILDDQGLLFRDDRTHIPHVYPSMYTNFLKDAGCLEWNHTWIITETGQEALETLKDLATKTA